MAIDVINPCPKIDGSHETATTRNSSKEENILKLTGHVHHLETAAPTTNKKRCYDDVGKDDIDEAMMADSADKDIIIENLKREIEALKVIAKTAEETLTNKDVVIDSLK